MSELARAPLPDDVNPQAFAQHVGIRYAPGTVTVLLDGEPVAEGAARLFSGTAEAVITARPAPDASAYLLQWTFSTPE